MTLTNFLENTNLEGSPLISVIVPTKNEEKNIGRLINSIQKTHGYSKDKIEIIVVDNPGTTDKTREIANQFGNVELFIQGPERSSQRNLGASKAKGQYLYFVDADMEFGPDTLNKIVVKLSPQTTLIVPEQIPGNSIYCRAINVEKQIYKSNPKISAARIMTKVKFTQVGGYDTEMVSGEDWDLYKRLQDSGLKVDFVDSHILHNEQDLTFWSSISKKIYYAKKLKNYKVGIQTEVNPIYRIAILFGKPQVIFSDFVAWVYLVLLKMTQFGVGFVIYKMPN